MYDVNLYTNQRPDKRSFTALCWQLQHFKKKNRTAQIFDRTIPPSGSRDSVVSIATRYGLDGPGIESRWGEIFRTYPDRLRGPPSLLYNGYRVFPGGKGGRGVMLTTHPLLVPRLRKSWAIPPLTPWVLLGLLRGYLYLYYTPVNKQCTAQSSNDTFAFCDASQTVKFSAKFRF